jgi:hypothetical protein
MHDRFQIVKTIRESNEIRIQNRLRYLADVFYIYQRNHRRLDQLLRVFYEPETMLPLWNVKRRSEMDLVIKELLVYLHNYLAATKTLVDHTRTMMRTYYAEHPFIKEYQKQVDKEFTSNPLAKFIHDLRNYMLHYSLPETLSELNITKNQDTGQPVADTGVRLSKETLLTWSGWKVPAKRFLDDLEGDIDLLEIIGDHEAKVRAFNEWLLNRLKEVHSEELQWLEEKFDELERLSA